jgi:hypothetical protein
VEHDGPELEAQREGLAQLFSDHQHLEARLIAVRQVVPPRHTIFEPIQDTCAFATCP